jgi:hypothetical protein
MATGREALWRETARRHAELTQALPGDMIIKLGSAMADLGLQALWAVFYGSRH